MSLEMHPLKYALHIQFGILLKLSLVGCIIIVLLSNSEKKYSVLQLIPINSFQNFGHARKQGMPWFLQQRDKDCKALFVSIEIT